MDGKTGFQEWLMVIRPDLVQGLEFFKEDLANHQHEFIRLYVSFPTHDFGLLSFANTDMMLTHLPDNEPLTKETSSHISQVRDFHLKCHGDGWQQKVVDELFQWMQEN